jgi:hypothetical protein
MALKLVYQIDFLLVLKGEGLSDFDPAQARDFFEIKIKSDSAKVKVERDKMIVTIHSEPQEPPALYELDSTAIGDLQKSSVDVKPAIEPKSAAAAKK